MRGKFVTWVMGAVCVPLIAASAFALVVPSEADRLLFGRDTAFEQPIYIQKLHHPLSQTLPDCVVVGQRAGYEAKRLDDTPVTLGRGTVLEGRAVPRGYQAYRALVLNGPHAGHMVELSWQGWRGSVYDEGSSWSPLRACTWAVDAELGGLWEDRSEYSERLMRRAEDAVPEGLWEDADEETRWLMSLPEGARARAAQRHDRISRHEGEELPKDEVLRTLWYVEEMLGNSRMAAAWIDRFGVAEPPTTDTAAQLASLR